MARYVRLIAEGRYQDAIEVIRETVLISIPGWVPGLHPCEEERRGGPGE